MEKISNFPMKKILKQSRTEENMGTGLIGEAIIISSYKQMPLDKLIKLRFILNKIIKQKKEQSRMNHN